MQVKKTILFISTSLQTGGAEVMLYRLVAGIKDGFSPVVICLAADGEIAIRIRELGIPVYCMNMRPGKTPGAGIIYKMYRLAKRCKPDIIQGWMYHGNLAAQTIRYLLLRSIPVLWTIHHSILDISREKPATAHVIRLCARLSSLPFRIIYVSAASRLQHASIGYNDRKALVINNGVDTELFQPSADLRLSLREELKLPPDTILIGLLARFHPMKDHLNFLKAAALLQSRVSNTYFVLAGTQIDVNNNWLVEMILQLGVKQYSLLGERSEPQKLLAGLDILSLSSFGEAFPLVVLEAMSCGVPCVCTNVGDVAAMIANTGVVVPPNDPNALADGWERLLLAGKEGRNSIGARARERVLVKYSLPAVVQEYKNLYDIVLKER